MVLRPAMYCPSGFALVTESEQATRGRSPRLWGTDQQRRLVHPMSRSIDCGMDGAPTARGVPRWRRGPGISFGTETKSMESDFRVRPRR